VGVAVVVKDDVVGASDVEDDVVASAVVEEDVVGAADEEDDVVGFLVVEGDVVGSGVVVMVDDVVGSVGVENDDVKASVVVGIMDKQSHMFVGPPEHVPPLLQLAFAHWPLLGFCSKHFLTQNESCSAAVHDARRYALISPEPRSEIRSTSTQLVLALHSSTRPAFLEPVNPIDPSGNLRSTATIAKSLLVCRS
jgi:hypothetical protein